ncbi:MAG: amidohydrolase family protein [Candidatus Methylomirabilia bacterium]
MAIDVHAHYIPPRVLRELERNPTSYGVGVERQAHGGVRLLFPGQGYTRPVLPALLDLERRVDELAKAEIHHQLLANWMDAVGYALPPDTGARWSRLYNESLAEALREPAAAGRFSGVATVPLQDGKRAADELIHAVQSLGLKGVQIGTNVLGRNLDTVGLDAFWEMAAGLRVPIILHPWHVAGEERMQRHGMVRLIGYPADTTLAAASIIFGGIADRFPDLRVVLVHAGGFYPYQAGRLQRGLTLQPEPKPATSVQDSLRWFNYDTITHMPEALAYLAGLVGIERIVLGSDAPFDVGDPTPVATVRAAGLRAEPAAAILERNAVTLFRLDPAR